MTSLHVWGIACGEMSVESADHEQYRRTVETCGETFLNSYALGWVCATVYWIPINVCFSGNGKTWSCSTSARMHSASRLHAASIFDLTPLFTSPLYTFLFPFWIEPYSDGRSWARGPGFERHLEVHEGEELTDPEDDE
ncbi:hypothetical protein C8Q72DRAFT_484780 [Fomitopsis betulina]|nr:hypothetical protein C8Q72DRAFT_484780 [Fomitopsis betulina]